MFVCLSLDMLLRQNTRTIGNANIASISDFRTTAFLVAATASNQQVAQS